MASIPRRLLDPRRPRGAPTSSDKEEMLVPYDPLIGPEIKRVVSHKYQVSQSLGLYAQHEWVKGNILTLSTIGLRRNHFNVFAGPCGIDVAPLCPWTGSVLDKRSEPLRNVRHAHR